MPELPEQQNATEIVQYPASLELFNYHYPNNPVLPAAVLIGEWIHKLSTSFPDASFSLTNIDFHQFILPDQHYIFTQQQYQQKHRWALLQGKQICVSAHWCLSTAKQHEYIPHDNWSLRKSENLVMARGSVSRSLRLPGGFRNQQFRFMDEYETWDKVYSTTINTAYLIERFSYLREITNPALFILLEAAGNLALMCLREKNNDTVIASDHVINRFMFCKFAAIHFYSVAVTKQLMIETTARPVSQYLVWSANVFTTAGDCLLSVDKAISVRHG